MTLHLHEYPNWTSFVKHAKEHSDKDNGQSQQEYEGNDAKWAGATWGAALKLAEKGWPEGYEAVRRTSEALYGRVTNKLPVPEVVWKEVPDMCVLDMGRYVDGEPECWIETQDTEVFKEAPSTKTVHLVVNCAASCGVGTSVIFTRGAAAVALAEALEVCGRAVKITLIGTTSDDYVPARGGSHMEIRVVVKDYDQRANYDILAFALCHGATLRRLCFAEMESFPAEVRAQFHVGKSGNYAYPADTRGDKGDVYMGSAKGHEPQWHSEDAAEKWILDELVKQGVHVEGKDEE